MFLSSFHIYVVKTVVCGVSFVSTLYVWNDVGPFVALHSALACDSSRWLAMTIRFHYLWKATGIIYTALVMLHTPRQQGLQSIVSLVPDVSCSIAAGIVLHI